MKSQLELKEFLEKKLVESETERDKWHKYSKDDDRSFVRENVLYYCGEVNVIRDILYFINDEGEK